MQKSHFRKEEGRGCSTVSGGRGDEHRPKGMEEMELRGDLGGGFQVAGPGQRSWGKSVPVCVCRTGKRLVWLAEWPQGGHGGHCEDLAFSLSVSKNSQFSQDPSGCWDENRMRERRGGGRGAREEAGAPLR